MHYRYIGTFLNDYLGSFQIHLLHLSIIALFISSVLVGDVYMYSLSLKKPKRKLVKGNDISWVLPFPVGFLRPSSDGTYYGMVSVRPGLHPTLRPSVRLSVRPSDSPSVRPTLRPSGSPSARFPHFCLTCFDTLSWNFAHDFVLMYYRSSSSVVNLRQFWRSYGSLELRI